MKVETNIITSFTASPIGRAVILAIMCVKIFIIDVIIFIGSIIMCLTSHCPIIFSIRISWLILKISLSEIKG